VPCAIDLCCIALDAALRQLGERPVRLFYHESDRLFVIENNRVLRDALGENDACEMACFFETADFLEPDEWILEGMTKAIYSPGA
jgi:hypothetical protein